MDALKRHLAPDPFLSFVAPGAGLMRGETMRLLSITVAAVMLALPLGAYAQLPAERPQAAVLLSMTESLLATATMVRTRMAGAGPIKEIKWTATYGARNWMVSLQGQDGPLRITMTGFLWGNSDFGWAANYAGNGQLGDEQIHGNGRTIWPRGGQSSFSDYEFQHVMEFGSHSLWGWIRGAEIVVGGTVGAAAGMETPVTAVVGAIGGASGLISLSNVVVAQFENAPQPPSQPPRPARPAPPQPGNMLVANAEQSYIVVGGDGNIKGAGPRAQDNDFYAVRGTYTETEARGEVYLAR
jgi:hypothetical protein